MHLLLVEDDPRLQRVLRRLLEDDRHVVEVATDGESALEVAEATTGIETVILDVGLPGISGLEVAKALRRDGRELAILMLTARERPQAGRAVPGSRRPEPILAAGPIALDERSRRVTVDGRAVDLSPREFSLLECFLRHPGQSLTRDQLLDQAWPFSVAVTPNAVDADVHYLRTKLGVAGRWIETVRGVGYRLADG